jgi:4-diphosphocytidyl-2-C-methyl-D-erythritol kinase
VAGAAGGGSAVTAGAKALQDTAPGKVNLCLFLGETRPDGLHELVSLVQALSLADGVALQPAGGAGDEVVCPGVDGPNLAAEALAAYRSATGWEGPGQRLTIAKRVPVAAGMGGGSSDAAAALRLAARAAGRPGDPVLAALAPGLGADVPALLRPGLSLVRGAGEDVRPLPALAPFRALVLPSRERLATPDVFREADRLGLPRPAEDLARRAAAVAAAVRAGGPLPAEHLVNDLEPAARSLCPAIDEALAAAREAGAAAALVSGSGPTVVGLFPGEAPGLDGRAAALAGRFPGACAADPIAGIEA